MQDQGGTGDVGNFINIWKVVIKWSTAELKLDGWIFILCILFLKLIEKGLEESMQPQGNFYSQRYPHLRRFQVNDQKVLFHFQHILIHLEHICRHFLCYDIFLLQIV
jgi:hypothetical protein